MAQFMHGGDKYMQVLVLDGITSLFLRSALWQDMSRPLAGGAALRPC
jgi:hypothetical protein